MSTPGRPAQDLNWLITNFVERVPDQTVKRLVDILKMVSLGENELQSMPKEKVSENSSDCYSYTHGKIPSNYFRFRLYFSNIQM